ncbi:hypothetical protein E3N88_01712 [Mikania micrantha]|uniref:Cysteine-rich receptor-like protein kinase 2 n=1 Tax=Mikania micrantha TaxID=192012 RepID=A0A5N6Q3B9_9ASTR|nr:hypothetical protein E3N88_01712 [Mikania micrantha]
MKPLDNSTWWSWGLTIFLVVITTAGPVGGRDAAGGRWLSAHFAAAGRMGDAAVLGAEQDQDFNWEGYVSKADCVACFDYAIIQLRDCGFANGAYVFFDDCDIRYENYNFYTESKVRTANLQCNNQSSTQQPDFKKTANMLLSDLRIVVPRTSNFYAASTRDLASGKATVYAIGQCNLNISQRDSSKKRAIIGGVVGGLCFLFLLLAFFLWRLVTKNSSSSQLDKSTGSTALLQGPARYGYDDLRKATNNFSNQNRLGGGVFGELYKGTLKNGDIVAIKKTSMISTSGKININDELKIICDKSRNLSWKQRYEIIYGTTRGLAYLHEQYHVTIIHRDIKPSNILLDNDLQPKIADFGMIRLLPEDKTHLSTKFPRSLESAYVAPEYTIHGQLSEKVDTYSFGIVVLEIISGKRCHNTKDEESVNQSLLDHAWNLYDIGEHLKILDDTLDPSEYEAEEAKKMIEIALMCTQSPVSTRPGMSEVVTLISDKSLDQMPPVSYPPLSRFHLISLNYTNVLSVGTSQPINTTENNTNTPIRSLCGRNPPIILSNFINNRNSTFAEIRRQLSNGIFYARAKSLSEGDSVFGLGQCRNYISTAQCVACFDAGVAALASCLTGNGAYVFFDNCFVRYANYDDFYNNPDVVEDVGVTPLGICGNESASQPTFGQDVNRLLSDIRDATPKTSNFYVASTTQITSDNATVYAIAQCVENINKGICRNCINMAYNSLSNCLPNTEARFINMGCFARYSVTPFFNDNQTIDITNYLKGNSSKVPVIAGAIGGAVLIIIIVLCLLFRRWKKSKKTEEDSLELKGAINYNYEELQLATNNFSEENILGKGGFGQVFKAILQDNNIVAVKKIIVDYARAKAKEEFENEVKLISNVHHRNLLRLLGWSSDGSNLFLVLEYMSNGSLDRFLWGAKRGTLNWKQRYDIIFGIARGLAHLHNEFHVKIIHRDIKSSNILLDHDLQPKIADFGLARFQPEDISHISTKFAGTLGYTAPEYALQGILSDKVDTYSFGIVILEIISGRRCSDMNSDKPSMDYLLEHAWKLYENAKHVMFIDETLDVKGHEQHVMQIIEIALLCTQSPASKRPTMSEVVTMLPNGLSLGKRQLTRPTLIDHNRRVHVGSPKKGNDSQMPKELDAKLKLQSVEVYDKVDKMEKGMNVEMHS